MIYNLFPKLKEYNIVLASASPRRKEILENLGLEFKISKSNFLEDLDKSQYTPIEYCTETAYLKTLDVYNALKDEIEEPLLIIGGDTIIKKDDLIIEKPKDKHDALNILDNLQDNTHQVVTCVCLLIRKDTKKEFVKFIEYCKTEVTFDKVDKQSLQVYIDSEEPLDKAGAYGIQGLGSLFIKEIKGDYYGVMGFPVNTFYNLLKKVFKE